MPEHALTDDDDDDARELAELRARAARLRAQLDYLHANRPPVRTREQIAKDLGISVWEVREHERLALLKARRAAQRLLSDHNNHQP